MTVNKKTFIATTIISTLLISLVAGMHTLELTKANFAPTPIYTPTVVVENDNFTTFFSSSINLIFNATHEYYYYGFYPNIKWFNYILDEDPPVAFLPIILQSNVTNHYKTTEFNATLLAIPNGSHKIVIQVKMQEIIMMGGDAGSVIGTSAPYYFYLDAPSPTTQPSILPTQSVNNQPSTSPTINPTSISSILTLSPNPSSSSSPTKQPTLEPSQTLDNVQAGNFTPTIIIFGLVIVAVMMGVLVYFKKIKK
jgi:hypothetical protein